MRERLPILLRLLFLIITVGASTALVAAAPLAPGLGAARPRLAEPQGAQTTVSFAEGTITPAQASTEAPTTITITLANTTFTAAPQARMTTCPGTGLPNRPTEADLTEVRLIDSRTLSATVPGGMSEGIYGVQILAEGEEIVLTGAPLTVIRPADGRPGAWRATSSLIRPRWQFAAAAGDGWLYVVGNQPGADAGIVEGAPIRADGSLGPWQDQPPLNVPRVLPAVVAAGGYLYAIGGFNAELGVWGPLGSIERAPMLPAGGLGPWELVADPPFARGGAAATLAGGRVYLIGGIGPDDLRNSAFVADVSPSGDLGAWRVVEAPPLLDGQSLPNALVVSHRSSLFYLGGIDRMVYRTDVLPDGSLAPWRPAGPGLGVHVRGGAAVIGDTLYAVGGFFNCIYGSNFVERATIRADGTLGPWEPAASTTFGHGSGALVASGSYLYAIAGLSGFGGPMTGVDYAQVGPITPAQELVPQVWLPIL